MIKTPNLNKEKSHIKIASWNINKFESSSVAEITKIIVDENLDIIFLHEFPTNSIHKFMNEVNKVYQTQNDLISQQPLYERDYNITLVLIKENLKTYIKTIPMIDDMPFKLRLIQLELFINDNSINILGLHCPIYVDKMDNLKRSKQIDIFWDKLLDYSKSKELMLIGDFNVNLLKQNKFTRKLKNIMDNGYIDLDSKLKQNTFIADTRIDYVLLHNSLATLSNNGALIIPKYIQDNPSDEFRYSDHRMIITEVDLQ
ncbi:endonuclease/exonuclease/phosphatase family protein [Amedibacillus sp. YH-ame6]